MKRTSGAKTFIELIAVYAANQEEKMTTKSYIRTFKRFIDYVKDFGNLNIHFENDEYGVLDKSWPRVMDPVNPFNNLAKNWKPTSIEKVKEYAKESHRRLEVLRNDRMARLDQLFEAQPVYRPDMREIFGCNPSKSQWLTGTKTFSLLPDLKVRNELFHTDPKLCRGLEIVKNYFRCAVVASRASGCDEKQTGETVQKTISKQIFNTELTWSPAENEQHDDYDITFTIPCSDEKAVRISFKL